MSQLTTSLILTGDERALTAALQRGEASLDGFNQATRRTTQAMGSARQSAATFEAALIRQKSSFDQLRRSIDPVYAASKQYEAVVNETQRAVMTGSATQAEANRVMALAEAQYLATGRSAQVMAGSQRVAAGSIGNIAAQFNDIGVMLAAGQNPLQLALQQGTQLNQEFARMGSGVTVLRSLGTAAMSLVNPISLATLGIIAGGAALAQWGISALSAEDETNQLTDAIAKLKQEAEEASVKVRMFLTGTSSEAELTVVENIARLTREIADLTKEAEGDRGRNAGAIRQQIAGLERERDLAIEELDLSDQKIEKAEQLARIQEQANRAGAEYVARLEAERTAAEEAERMISALNDQAALQLMITQFGEDSVAVAQLRHQQERAIFVEMTNSSEVSDELKQRQIAAWDAANGIATAGMASNISAAAGEASRLAEQLGISFDLASRMAAMGNQGVSTADENGLVYSGRGGNPLEMGGRAIDIQTAPADQFLSTYKAPSTRGGGRGGRGAGGGGQDQSRIIRQIEREFARLEPSYERDTEALLRWREEALAQLNPAAAGYAEFASDVEELFGLKLAKAYQDDLARRDDWAAGVERGFNSVRDDMMSFADLSEGLITEWSSGMEGAFVDVAKTGKIEIGDLVDYTLEQFLRLQYQQTIQPGIEAGFGFLTDWVSGWFGGGSGTTATQSHAGSQIGTGGVRRTYGPGAPLRADERLTVTTVGQRVFTPEQIANGSTVVDALAQAAQGAQNAGQGVVFAPQIVVENRGSTPVNGQIEETTDDRGQRRYKLVLADEVGQAMTTRGGGAKRTLRQEYGVNRLGTPR